MTNEILSNQDGISDIHGQVSVHIDKLYDIITTYIQNAGLYAVANWKGQNANSFKLFMEDLSVIGTVLIDEARAINQSALDSAQSFKGEDRAIANDIRQTRR